MKKVFIIFFFQILTNLSFGKIVITELQKQDSTIVQAVDTISGVGFEQLCDVLLDIDSYSNFMPNMTESKIFFKNKNNIIGFYKLKVLFYTVEYYSSNFFEYKDNIFVLKWRDYSPPNFNSPFLYNFGYWEIKKNENKVIIIYKINMKYKTPISQIVKNKLLKVSIPSMFEAIIKESKRR